MQDSILLKNAAAIRSLGTSEVSITTVDTVLHANPPVLIIGADAAHDRVGRQMAHLAANLLSRLYAGQRIHLLVEGGDDLAAEIATAIAATTDCSCSESFPAGARWPLVLGSPQRLYGVNPLFWGGDGFTFGFSRTESVGLHGVHPLAGAIGTCVALLERFKSMFGGLLHPLPTETPAWCHSVLTGGAGETILAGDWDKPLNLPTTHLFGAGAVGNGFLYGLSLLPSVAGMMHVIDNSQLTTSNLQRYILSCHHQVGQRKPELAQSWMAHTGLQVVPHTESLNEFFSGPNRDFHIEWAIAALDTPRARVELQLKLPRRVANGWTRAWEVGAYVSAFDEAGPCLACSYIDQEPPPGLEQQMAAAIGLPEMEIRRMRRENARLTREQLLRIAGQFGGLDRIAHWEGRAIQSFYQEQVCGGLPLAVGSVGSEEAPVAHISVLAGLLLAVEYLKAVVPALRVYQRPGREWWYTQKDLAQLRTRMPAPKAERCFCGDDDYLEVYRQKYSGRDLSAS